MQKGLRRLYTFDEPALYFDFNIGQYLEREALSERLMGEEDRSEFIRKNP